MIKLDLQEVSDGLHVALGAIFVLLPVCWEWHFAQAWGTGLGILFAIIKEMWFDIHYEDCETSGGYPGGFRDMAGYFVGILLANLLVIL